MFNPLGELMTMGQCGPSQCNMTSAMGQYGPFQCNMTLEIARQDIWRFQTIHPSQNYNYQAGPAGLRVSTERKGNKGERTTRDCLF